MTADRIRIITLPTPFPAGPANAYLVGDPPVLVDCGPDTEPARLLLERSLRKLGIHVSDLVGVVITHAHPDHAGFAGRLGRQGIPVYVHPLDVPSLELDDDYLLRRERNMLRAGMPPRELSALVTLTVQSRQYIAPLADVVRPLGTEFPGDASWTVLHTPGHTSGHVCLFHPASKKLLSGDCLLRGIIPAPGLEAASSEISSHLDAYDRSMQTLFDLDVTTVYPGHGEPFEQHRDVIRRWREHRRRREQRVLAALSGKDATAYDLSRRIYPDAHGRDLLMALADTTSHLASLLGRNLVAGTVEGDVVIYQAMGTSEGSDDR